MALSRTASSSPQKHSCACTGPLAQNTNQLAVCNASSLRLSSTPACAISAGCWWVVAIDSYEPNCMRGHKSIQNCLIRSFASNGLYEPCDCNGKQIRSPPAHRLGLHTLYDTAQGCDESPIQPQALLWAVARRILQQPARRQTAQRCQSINK